jgi:hypothetical protein
MTDLAAETEARRHVSVAGKRGRIMGAKSTGRAGARGDGADSLPLVRMRCPSCNAEIVDPQGVFCSRCGASIASSEAETTELPDEGPAARADDTVADTAAPGVPDARPSPEATNASPSGTPPADTSIDVEGAAATSESESTGPETAADETPLPDVPPQGAGAIAAEMVVSVGRVLRSERWIEAASAASMGFLAVLGVGALFVGLLKLVEPTFGSGRSPLWVLTRVVIAGLAALGIPIESGGIGGSILPMGTLVLIAWALIWASRTVVAAGGHREGAERAIEGAKVGAPFGLLCCVAALVFRVREGLVTGADPGLALVIGGLWGAAFGALGGLLADGTARRTGAADRRVARLPGLVREGLLAGTTMLVAATVVAMAAALVYVIVTVATGSELQMTAGDAAAVVILLVAFAPNIAVGTLAFSMGAPIQFVADSLGVGFRTNFSLFGWGGAGPEWYLYLAVLIPLLACLFGGYSARRRTSHPSRMIEVIGVAAGSLSLALSFFAFIGALSLERGLLGPGNLLVLAPDSSAVFFLSMLWAGIFGVLGWKVADSYPGTSHAEDVAAESTDRSGTSRS